MGELETGELILTLGIFIGAAHVLGWLFEKMRQPRLVGEILAGIVLGPFVLGKISPWGYGLLYGPALGGTGKTSVVLGFMYWFGVLLLMFISGSQVKNLLSKENRSATAWLLGVGATLPFFLVVGLCLGGLVPLGPLMGPRGVPSAAVLVLACAVAVTSIPVISRIFSDLGILHTRFASLILGCALFEDILLWAVLAIAVALSKAGTVPDGEFYGTTSAHIAVTLAYMGAAILLMPRLLRKLRQTKYNIIFKSSRLAYAIFVLFGYVGFAAYLEVNLVFAAFLAGFGLAGGLTGEQKHFFSDAFDAIGKFSYSVFIPVYFALVGNRLVFDRDFSMTMLVAFLVGSSLIALVARALAARLAGFGKLDCFNIAVTSNARGGPGIVMASIAYDAGIIGAAFYTTMVVTAILTSQGAGIWLRYVLRSGYPLLSTNPGDETTIPGLRGPALGSNGRTHPA